MIQNKIVNDEARDQLRDQGTATLKTKIKKLKQRKRTGKKNMENDRPIEWKDSKDSKKRNNDLPNRRSGYKTVLSVILFIEDAMRVLSNYWKTHHLKNQSNI